MTRLSSSAQADDPVICGGAGETVAVPPKQRRRPCLLGRPHSRAVTRKWARAMMGERMRAMTRSESDDTAVIIRVSG